MKRNDHLKQTKFPKKIKKRIFLKNETKQIFKLERFFEKQNENEKERKSCFKSAAAEMKWAKD